MKWFSYIIDIFFPSRCVSCGKSVSYHHNNLCNDCLSDIKYIEKKCEICSGIIVDGTCTICSDREFYPKKNISVAEYEGVIKELLHNYKFSRRRRLHKHLSKITEEKINKNEIKVDQITSVPINRKKMWERGFNQSELIAKDLSKKLHLPYMVLLKEKKQSPTQKTLGYGDRFINVLNRYTVKSSDKVKGKKILIIDDVFTTGATINECARILLQSGSSEVFSLTIARAGIKKLEKI